MRLKYLSLVAGFFAITNVAIAQKTEKYNFFGMAMSVNDLEKSIKWYRETLGFKVLERSEFPVIHAKTAFIEGAGLRLELLQVDNPIALPQLFADPPEHMRPVGNKALILFVDDLGKTTKLLERMNIRFAFKEIELNDKGLKSTIIRDPDGNFISIFSKKGMVRINRK